jgi:hypothetical protein
MPDWHRIIVGDAFKVSSRSINYYRDLALAPPFLWFSIISILALLSPESPAYRAYGVKLAVCAIVAILLAKERLILITSAVGFVTVRLAIALLFRWNSIAFVAVLVTGGMFFAILRLRRDWTPSYEWPEKMYILDLLVGTASFGLTLALAIWMRP